MYTLIACTVLSAAGVLAVLVCEGRSGGAWPGGIAKMIASTAFLAVAWLAGALDTGFGTAIFAGLVLSWFGDLFLIFRAKPVFLAGLIAFFGGHVAYVVAFCGYGFERTVALGTGVVMVALALHVFVWLHPHLTEMRVPGYAYMLVISVMVALAVGAWSHGKTHEAGGMPWAFALGAWLFYVSDIFVARDRFVAPGSVNRYLGLPLYYAGQLLLAWSAGNVAVGAP